MSVVVPRSIAKFNKECKNVAESSAASGGVGSPAAAASAERGRRAPQRGSACPLGGLRHVAAAPAAAPRARAAPRCLRFSCAVAASSA
ncbi:hypothetical protein HF086_014320 [Spodoptera exigua]|uniref:Uncharacterized protein n=1 Tax=Spodoptera exigua TaxID=7107 RepID=A0A922MJN3_SPOEX|nr:hypothetical protein HF086_014320 [Spodoptera exigua]